MWYYPSCKSAINVCNKKGWAAECRLAVNFCQAGIVSRIMGVAGNFNVYDVRLPCVGPLCYDFSTVDKFLNLPSTREWLGVGDMQCAPHPPPPRCSIALLPFPRFLSMLCSLCLPPSLPILCPPPSPPPLHFDSLPPSLLPSSCSALPLFLRRNALPPFPRFLSMLCSPSRCSAPLPSVPLNALLPLPPSLFSNTLPPPPPLLSISIPYPPPSFPLHALLSLSSFIAMLCPPPPFLTMLCSPSLPYNALLPPSFPSTQCFPPSVPACSSLAVVLLLDDVLKCS